MDRNPSAIIWELLRSGLGMAFLFDQGDWFGASVYLESAKYILGAYFVLSCFITGWFVMKHRKEDRQAQEVVLA